MESVTLPYWEVKKPSHDRANHSTAWLTQGPSLVVSLHPHYFSKNSGKLELYEEIISGEGEGEGKSRNGSVPARAPWPWPARGGTVGSRVAKPRLLGWHDQYLYPQTILLVQKILLALILQVRKG